MAWEISRNGLLRLRTRAGTLPKASILEGAAGEGDRVYLDIPGTSRSLLNRVTAGSGAIEEVKVSHLFGASTQLVVVLGKGFRVGELHLVRTEVGAWSLQLGRNIRLKQRIGEGNIRGAGSILPGFGVPVQVERVKGNAGSLSLLGISDKKALRSLEMVSKLGVVVIQRAECGGPSHPATYNMGANVLCLSTALERDPQERAKVIQHQLVHVVQDCLDGLGTPTSLTLAEGLRSSGQLSGEQVNGFFLQHLRKQGNLNHVVESTRHLPLESRQREFEAYALQADPAMVANLLRSTCIP